MNWPPILIALACGLLLAWEIIASQYNKGYKSGYDKGYLAGFKDGIEHAHDHD